VILEEIKIDEDNPDVLVHEIFTQNFWKDQPLGKPILGTTKTVSAAAAYAASTTTTTVSAPEIWSFRQPGGWITTSLWRALRRSFRRCLGHDRTEFSVRLP
jgi:hypothetical protein